jgi:hypothetical protein
MHVLNEVRVLYIITENDSCTHYLLLLLTCWCVLFAQTSGDGVVNLGIQDGGDDVDDIHFIKVINKWYSSHIQHLCTITRCLRLLLV